MGCLTSGLELEDTTAHFTVAYRIISTCFILSEFSQLGFFLGFPRGHLGLNATTIIMCQWERSGMTLQLSVKMRLPWINHTVFGPLKGEIRASISNFVPRESWLTCRVKEAQTRAAR